MSPRPAGWYPHPDLRDALGYWNGTGWTGHAAPIPDGEIFTAPPQLPAPVEASHSVPVDAAPAPRPSRPARSGAKDLDAVGYVLAILFPIAGVVVGIALLGKDRLGPGLAVIATAVLATLVYAWLFVNLA